MLNHIGRLNLLTETIPHLPFPHSCQVEGELGLSQEDLAERMGTTGSTVSRIESGQHATTAKTLKRLGEALGGHAVIGFDIGSAKRPKREPVVL